MFGARFRGIPLEDCLGIETIDTNLEIILSVQDVDSIVQALCNLDYYCNNINVEDRIYIQNSSILVFTLLGQCWTYVYKPVIETTSATDTNRVISEYSEFDGVDTSYSDTESSKSFFERSQEYLLASEISKLTKSEAIYFVQSDTGCWMHYSLFDFGECFESLTHTLDDTNFFSRHKNISINESDDVYDLINSFIVDKRAYIPYLIQGQVRVGREYKLVELLSFDKIGSEKIRRVVHLT
jgi:hypothetical protein